MTARPCIVPPPVEAAEHRPTDPCPEGPDSLRAERVDAFLDVLAERALREDPDVIGTILTVASGSLAVGADSEALTARILGRGRR